MEHTSLLRQELASGPWTQAPAQAPCGLLCTPNTLAQTFKVVPLPDLETQSARPWSPGPWMLLRSPPAPTTTPSPSREFPIIPSRTRCPKGSFFSSLCFFQPVFFFFFPQLVFDVYFILIFGSCSK